MPTCGGRGYAVYPVTTSNLLHRYQQRDVGAAGEYLVSKSTNNHYKYKIVL